MSIAEGLLPLETTAERGWNSHLSCFFCARCFYQNIKDETHCPKCAARFMTRTEIDAAAAINETTPIDLLRESAFVRKLADYWVGWSLIAVTMVIAFFGGRAIIEDNRIRASVKEANAAAAIQAQIDARQREAQLAEAQRADARRQAKRQYEQQQQSENMVRAATAYQLTERADRIAEQDGAALALNLWTQGMSVGQFNAMSESEREDKFGSETWTCSICHVSVQGCSLLSPRADRNGGCYGRWDTLHQWGEQGRPFLPPAPNEQLPSYMPPAPYQPLDYGTLGENAGANSALGPNSLFNADGTLKRDY